ncbi:MAG: GGDEF domain-containing protein [Spirochaetales bacterium]|nr:GGDEF domain-containing protein [Spirochaetales bacterium]
MINVGIIVTDLCDIYQQSFINGFKSYCSVEKMRFFVFIANDFRQDKENKWCSVIKDSDLDFIVILSVPLITKLGDELFHLFISHLPHIPILSIGVKLENKFNIHINGYDGIYQITEHFINHHGYKNIAFIKGPEENPEAIERFNAYKNCLIDHNIQINYKLISPGNFSVGDGRKALSLLMDVRKETFDAIICCDDSTAIEVIRSLKKRGLNVPNDVGVSGFDNIGLSSSFTPSLTTARQPVFNAGLKAGVYIFNILNKKELENDLKLDASVVIRESCGCTKFKNISPDNRKNLNYFDISESIKSSISSILGKYNSTPNISLQKIGDSILESSKTKNYLIIKDVIKEILLNHDNDQFDAAFWTLVLEEFQNNLMGINLGFEQRLVLNTGISNAFMEIFSTEKRLLDIILSDNKTTMQFINKISDLLLTCSSEDELRNILNVYLPYLNVENCFIVLYSFRQGWGELFFSKEKDKFLYENRHSFNLSRLIPHNLGEVKNSSFVISFIETDGIEKGYVITEFANASPSIYSLIAEKVSFSLKNISILNRLNSYNQELKEAVNKRTKELILVNKQLKERSYKDALTGLYNRRFLEDVISEKSKKLGSDSKYAVILVDLDYFKLVNDTYGHLSGDMVIKELGRVFSYIVRPEDYVIRIGGEEFLLILRYFKKDFLPAVVEKVRKSIEDTDFKVESGEIIHKTCSIGAMIYPPEINNDYININYALSIIDKCLYRSKNLGRNKGVIINIDSSWAKDVLNYPEYIVSNFDKCISEHKIELIDSKSHKLVD